MDRRRQRRSVVREAVRVQRGRDGELHRAYAATFGGCAGVIVSQDSGTAVADASSITLYATTVSETTTSCGTPSTVQKPAVTLAYTYTTDETNGPALLITDSSCASQYSDQASINLYCTYTYHPQ